MDRLDLESFRSHFEQWFRLEPEDKVVVGYSGGADSTALLHLLVTLGVKVVAAHLHHGMRPEADDEQRKCEAFCADLNIPFVAERVDVPEIARTNKIGLEEAGRKARYEFFYKVFWKHTPGLLATAHTRTDHIETILLHVIRGSGMTGLRGILHQDAMLIRPLLPYSREATRAYCIENALWFHDDPANSDPNFSRTRLRLNVLPQIAKINPAYATAIERLGEIAGAEDSYLDELTCGALKSCSIPLNGELEFLTAQFECGLSTSLVRELPMALKRRVLRAANHTLRSENLSFDQCQHIIEGIDGKTSSSVTLDGGDYIVQWSQKKVHFFHKTPPAPFNEVVLRLPGESIVLWPRDGHWQLIFQTEYRSTVRQKRAALKVKIPQSRIAEPLSVRYVEPGDRMRPLGFDGSRKVSDLMSEARLTRLARKLLPIVCDLSGPLWLPGVCLDARAKPESKRADPFPVTTITLQAYKHTSLDNASE